jgi:hypothetical protein
MKFKLFLTFAIVLVIGMLCTSPAYAQVAGAALSGTVTDPSGAAIPNAEVVITNTATGIARTLSTSGAGYYSAPNLNPGPYKVAVNVAGFRAYTRTGITLTVGAQEVVDVAMTVGEVSQTVEVTGDALAVQLASSSVSAEVNATTVRELPLNGRSWTELANLQVGVNAITTQPSFASGSDRGNRGFGAQSSISGASPQQNNYRMDGISINDYSNGAPGSVLGGNLGVDAVGEFSVLTSSFSAEYGKTAGGVINAITKSGTNSFHGSAYDFLRNSKLDARNFFDGPTIPEFRQNQFGASAGGRLIKDRTFIFGDYEGVRSAKGLTAQDTVPSANAFAGLLNYPVGTVLGAANPLLSRCTDNGVVNGFQQCKVTVDASAAKYFPFYHSINAGLIGSGNTGFYDFAGNRVVREDFFTIRTDHKISEKDSIFGTYAFDRTPYTSPDGYNNVLLGSFTKRQYAIVEETHMFSANFINTIRGGFNRNRVDNDVSSVALIPAAGDQTLATIPGRWAGQAAVTGLTSMSGGLYGNPTYFFRWNSFQGYDDAFLTRGTHTIKFGVAVERMEMNVDSFSNPNGVWNFPSLYAFLTNQPSKLNSTLPGSDFNRAFRQTLFGAYVQDDWRAKPNLTINLGLRYEMTTVLTEAQNRLVNLTNIYTNDINSLHKGSPLYKNPTLKDFEPRIGFAWDPFKTGKTSVRGGIGMFDVLPLPATFFLMENLAAPYYLLGSANAAKLALVSTTPFFAGGAAALGKNSYRTAYIEQNPHRPYVFQYNFNLQRSLTPNLTATIGYVGSHGVHQPMRSDDIDMTLPTLTSAGYLWPNPITSADTLNKNFGSMRAQIYDGMSYYNALTAQVVKNLSHGVQITGSFAWAKSMDTSSSTLAGDQFANSIDTLDFFDTKTSRALSDFQVGRTLVINGIWQIPGPKSATGITGFLTNGWQIGAIFQAADGNPFTATFGSDGDVVGKNASSTWAYPNRLTGGNCSSLINPRKVSGYIKTECFAVPTAPNAAFWTAHCDPAFGTISNLQCFNLRGNAGRNIVIGPGTTNLDFSVYKNTDVRSISENFKIQFRAEFFNVLNHANFAAPTTPDNTDIFDSTGASTGAVGILSRAAPSREIQFALKFTW